MRYILATLTVVTLLTSCLDKASESIAVSDLGILREKANANLEKDIDTFNAYKDRPASDGPFDATNNKEFLMRNTPLFYCSDSNLTQVFNYRFWMMSKHLRKFKDSLDNQNYWVFTEFFGNPGHASRSGAIPCPLGHQFYDARWIKDPQYLKSYADYFLKGSASTLNQRENGNFLTGLSRPESHHFSSWFINGIHAFLRVHPNDDWMVENLPYMERHQQVWDSLFTVKNPNSKTNGMYKIMDLYDGMEFSLSAVEGLIHSKGPFSLYTEENWKDYYLGWGTTRKAAETEQANRYPKAFNRGYPWYYLVRPSVNSYMYGNLTSLSQMYREVGNSKKHDFYDVRAQSVRTQTLDILWDEKSQFFMSYSAGDNSFGNRDFMASVRESVGYTPWYFHMIPKDKHNKYEVAWDFFKSEKGFYNDKGMTTAERQHPFYNEKAYAWNGRGWPFQNSVVYKAYANYLRYYKPTVTQTDRSLLMDYVNKLAMMHGRKDKNIGEWYIPSNGEEFGGVKDYFHSTFPDIIISDILGVKPTLEGSLSISPLLTESTWNHFYLGELSIHGKLLDIAWKRDWEPQKKGNQQALKIWVDGKLVSKTKNLNQTILLEADYFE